MIVGAVLLATFAVLGGLFVIHSVQAATGTQLDLGMQQVGKASGLTTTDIRTVVARIIRYFFALLGLIAVTLLIYAGFLWMTAQGNEERVADAKRIIQQTVIGLFIMLSAYAIAEYIIRSLTEEPGGGVIGNVAPPSSLSSIYCAGCGPDELGSGIIEYHYPEVGQTDVVRNTKIVITFKKPLKLSTVFRNYDDADSYDVSKHKVCLANCTNPANFVPVSSLPPGTPLELNTDNIKILPNVALKPIPATADPDAKFAGRYAATMADGNLIDAENPYAAVTAVAATYSPTNVGQTIAILPRHWIGSSTNDVNYRVGIRGGANGIKVWAPQAGSSDPIAKPAFKSLNADGSYFWSFTTGTNVDVTPPQVSAMNPRTVGDPATKMLVRNQLLQIYFDEPVDPTTASGIIGTGGSFNNVTVEARCLPSTDCRLNCDDKKDAAGCNAKTSCQWNAGVDGGVCQSTNLLSYVVIDGVWNIANKYRTLEFIPSTKCDGIAANTCGEPVYCLPKNVALRVMAKAPIVDPGNPPMSKTPLNPLGVTDMVGNSLDGNANGKAEGPGPAGDGAQVSNVDNVAGNLAKLWVDTISWFYEVSSNIDLTPPEIFKIDPLSIGNPPTSATAYPTGPSKVPATQPLVVTWTKVLSLSSLRTGRETDVEPQATVMLEAWERRKSAPYTSLCNPFGTVQQKANCDSVALGGTSPVLNAGNGPIVVSVNGIDTDVTRLELEHRPLFKANDLGWSEDDVNNYTLATPQYRPMFRAQLRDDRQNCFFPSKGYQCGTSASKSSCCERVGLTTFSCLP